MVAAMAAESSLYVIEEDTEKLAVPDSSSADDQSSEHIFRKLM